MGIERRPPFCASMRPMYPRFKNGDAWYAWSRRLTRGPIANKNDTVFSFRRKEEGERLFFSLY